MSIEKQLHRSASQSLGVATGPTMSPLRRAVPAIEPSHDPDLRTADGAVTSAIGSPKRVTRMGLRVLRTRSRTAKHVALNFEIAISSIAPPLTMVRNHGQNTTDAAPSCLKVNAAGTRRAQPRRSASAQQWRG